MRIFLSCLSCLAAIAVPASAVVVDRTAITVGNRVITNSEITRRIRLTAFQNGALPDFSLASRRETAQRLIDLKLVEREMDLGHYTRTSPAAAAELLNAFTVEHFQSSPEAVRLSLAAIGLTPADLQAEFAEQADLLLFTALRFRPAVEVSDQEIEQYYRTRVQPTNPISLAEARPNIERILADQRTDFELDAWLSDQRKRTSIAYLEKELQ
jgi:hypothetical protein